MTRPDHEKVHGLARAPKWIVPMKKITAQSILRFSGLILSAKGMRRGIGVEVKMFSVPAWSFLPAGNMVLKIELINRRDRMRCGWVDGPYKKV